MSCDVIMSGASLGIFGMEKIAWRHGCFDSVRKIILQFHCQLMLNMDRSN